jgi:hypothetical protein
MKKTTKANPKSDLHLVKPIEPASSPSSPVDLDSFIAEGMRSYQKLQDDLDHELFSRTHDVNKIGALIGQKQLVRSRLAAVGVKVRA